MPSLDALTHKVYSPKDWLTFYKNIWTRNLVARTIDVQNDMNLKAKNPDEPVEFPTPMGVVEIPVKQRLEHRKMLVADALEVLDVIDTILALGEPEIREAYWTEEALKVWRMWRRKLLP